MTLAARGLVHTSPYTWTYADAAARTGATGFTPDDVGGWAVQLDTGTVWELTDDSPVTWAQRAPSTGMTNPMTTAGDLIVGDTGGAAIRLALAGTNGHVLQRAAGAIAWGAVPSHTHAGADLTSGTIATARLGSGTADATTFLRGDQTWATPAGGGGSGGQQLGSARITSSVTTTSATPVDATGLSVTVTIGSRPVVVRAFGAMLDHSAAGGRCTAYLVDVTGSATVAEGYHTSAGANNGVPMVLMTDPLSPAAGSRSYKVQFDRGATAGTARLFATATGPAHITVEEV